MRVPGKPHFRFKGHVWSCASPLFLSGGWRIGFGYSVREAWHDWQRQRSYA